MPAAISLSIQSPEQRQQARREYFRRCDRDVHQKFVRLMTLARQVERSRINGSVDITKWREMVMLEISLKNLASIGRQEIGFQADDGG